MPDRGASLVGLSTATGNPVASTPVTMTAQFESLLGTFDCGKERCEHASATGFAEQFQRGIQFLPNETSFLFTDRQVRSDLLIGLLCVQKFRVGQTNQPRAG